jgi:hypothetical protein
LSGHGDSYGPAEDSALPAGAPQAKYNEVDIRLKARQVKPALSQKAWIDIRDAFLFNASMSGMVFGASL